jgi:hypothetical protein
VLVRTDVQAYLDGVSRAGHKLIGCDPEGHPSILPKLGGE